jgi:hypothetical protein
MPAVRARKTAIGRDRFNLQKYKQLPLFFRRRLAMSRHYRWPLLAAVLVGIFMIARASAVPGDAEDKTATDATTLLRRIAALEQRVATLEERPQIVQAPAARPVPEVPRSWSSLQFNGQTVYIVPLSGAKSNNKAAFRAEAASPNE